MAESETEAKTESAAESARVLRDGESAARVSGEGVLLLEHSHDCQSSRSQRGRSGQSNEARDEQCRAELRAAERIEIPRMPVSPLRAAAFTDLSVTGCSMSSTGLGRRCIACCIGNRWLGGALVAPPGARRRRRSQQHTRRIGIRDGIRSIRIRHGIRPPPPQSPLLGVSRPGCQPAAGVAGSPPSSVSSESSKHRIRSCDERR